MPRFIGRITLQGHTQGDRTTLTYDLGDLPLPVDALAAMTVVRNTLAAVTNAVVRAVTVTQIVHEDGSRPADQSADTFEEAAIVTYLNEDTEPEKLHVVRIPAPVVGLFQSDHQTVNTGNAQLLAYIDALGDHVLVSDGESIQTSNNDGVKYGYKRSRARRFRN